MGPTVDSPPWVKRRGRFMISIVARLVVKKRYMFHPFRDVIIYSIRQYVLYVVTVPRSVSADEAHLDLGCQNESVWKLLAANLQQPVNSRAANEFRSKTAYTNTQIEWKIFFIGSSSR